MFSNKIIAILALPTLFFLYLSWQVDEKYAPWIIPFLVAAALVYILKNEIDWWWHAKHPPKMAQALVALLERFCGFYRELDDLGKQKFCERVALFSMGTDWMPMGWPEDELPTDVKTAISAQAIMLTLHRPVFLFEKFEKVIVYPRPFPTEQHQFAHASELYEPDGCLLFSAEQIMRSFAEPTKWYNVGLHEYAKAFILTYPNEVWPDFSESDVWERLEQASGMSKQLVKSVVGLPDIAVLPVSIHHYFTQKKSFSTLFPLESEIYDHIFGQ